MRNILSAMLVAGFAIVAGCSGGGGGGINDPGGGGNPGGSNCPAGNICMGASSFNPTTITVANNATVTFNNNSTVDHNIVFDTPIPAATTNIGLLSYGSSAARTLATAGTYNFHCTIHAGMTGSVVVQ